MVISVIQPKATKLMSSDDASKLRVAIELDYDQLMTDQVSTTHALVIIYCLTTVQQYKGLIMCTILTTTGCRISRS